MTDPERDADPDFDLASDLDIDLDGDGDGDFDVDPDRDPALADRDPSPAGVDDVPTVSCTRCDRTWDLDYELDELRAGNRALEQFALDHQRHTGHYPDDLSPWLVTCRRCPAGEAFLDERPAHRWAEAHARHTRHAVTFERANADESEQRVVSPDPE